MTQKELAPNGAFCIEQTTQEYLESVIDTEIAVSELLQKVNKEDQIRISTKLLSDSCITYSEAANATKEVRIAVAQSRQRDPNYTPPDRFTTEMGVDGMVHIIRDKGTVEEAYNVVAEKHNKDVTSLIEVASKEHYNRGHIIEETSKVVPEQISKVREEGLMTMLDKPTTINSMFGNTYITMKVLGELDHLRSRVSELEVRQTITEARVDQLGETLGLTGCNKEIAIKLKALGMSNTAIAKQLNVRRETVSRWLSRSVPKIEPS